MWKEHRYAVSVEWTGNTGSGTSGYRTYSREHVIRAQGKPEIAGSADRVFYGDRERWNPEELLLAALSQCHMLSYLYAAAQAGVVVVSYTDEARGAIEQDRSGGGRFVSAELRPRVVVTHSAMVEQAAQLHAAASEKCFIASSVNFPVSHIPETIALAA